MCTALALHANGLYFGRNMDISYSFNEAVVCMPRNYPLTFKKESIDSHYAMIGTAYVSDNYALYADAMNEYGLCMAGLNFKGFAHYEPYREGHLNIAPYEMIPYFLGVCRSVSQAKKLMKDLVIMDIPFSNRLPLAPLHWMLSDAKESVVIEQTKEGLKVHDNPVGVLTNNPTFDFHLHNLSNYMQCRTSEHENTITQAIVVPSLGHGSGGLGLPGDTSSPSRFIKTVFLSSHATLKEETFNLQQFFHILDGVKVVHGSALTNEGVADYTTYSCCMDTINDIYYYRTYAYPQLNAVRFHKDSLSENLLIYEVEQKQHIHFVNE